MVSSQSCSPQVNSRTKFFPDWSLPDQLAYTTVSALLKLAAVHPEYRDGVMTAVTTFTSVLVDKLQRSPRECLFSAEYACLTLG